MRETHRTPKQRRAKSLCARYVKIHTKTRLRPKKTILGHLSAKKLRLKAAIRARKPFTPDRSAPTDVCLRCGLLRRVFTHITVTDENLRGWFADASVCARCAKKGGIR